MRRFFIAIMCVPLLVGCSSPANTDSSSETSFVAGDGTMTLIKKVDRGDQVKLVGQTLDDESLDISVFQGKVVVVNVWASWCGPCRSEAVELANVSKEFLNRGVQFVGLNTRDGLAAAKAFNNRFDTGYPSFRDKDGILTLAFGNLGPAATPTTIVLDKEGRVAARVLGPVTESQLRILINAVLEDS